MINKAMEKDLKEFDVACEKSGPIYNRLKNSGNLEIIKRLVDAFNGVGLLQDGIDTVWLHRAILLRKFVQDFTQELTDLEKKILLDMARLSEQFFDRHVK